MRSPRFPISPVSAWLPPSVWHVLKTETCCGVCTSGAAVSWGSRVERDPAPPSLRIRFAQALCVLTPPGSPPPHLIIGTDLGGPTAQAPQQGSLLALKVTSEAFSASSLTLGLVLLNPKSFPNPPGVDGAVAGAWGVGGDREAQPGT